MSSQSKVALASLVLLFAVSIFAYTRFNSFKPKNLQPLEEVHGVATTSENDIAFPQDYILLGTTKTESTKQITFETKLTAQEIQNFYRNIFTAKGWEVEYEGKAGLFLNTGYKRAGERIKVSSSNEQDSEITVVSVEIIAL